MVLLAYLKFCWRVLIFAGVVLGQNKGIFWRTASKILLAVRYARKYPHSYNNIFVRPA